MKQLFIAFVTVSKSVWCTGIIPDDPSLHWLSNCLLPVYSVRSIVEWFSGSGYTPFVKNDGDYSKKQFSSSHLTLKKKGGGVEKTLFATDI